MDEKRYGALNLQSGIYYTGTNPTQVQQVSGSVASQISQQSYQNRDSFLRYFHDIVDLNPPPMPYDSKPK